MYSPTSLALNTSHTLDKRQKNTAVWARKKRARCLNIHLCREMPQNCPLASAASTRDVSMETSHLNTPSALKMQVSIASWAKAHEVAAQY